MLDLSKAEAGQLVCFERYRMPEGRTASGPFLTSSYAVRISGLETSAIF